MSNSQILKYFTQESKVVEDDTSEIVVTICGWIVWEYEKEILGQKLEGDTLLYCKYGKIERISLGQLK